MSRREREHASMVPIAIVCFLVVTVVAVSARVCYEILCALGRVIGAGK